jgi:hypothetical protein
MTDTLQTAWIPHNLTPAQIEEYEERRAILEFDAGMDAFAADFEARRICKARWADSK